MTAVMMQCGHSANARNERNEPSCAICIGIHPGAELPIKSAPDLSGRMAMCDCRKTVPSEFSLPFFEYRGPDSERAKRSCRNCGYFDTAHTKEAMERNTSLKCLNFEPRGAFEFDSYYCGHGGWN